jgi:hypothetical protein
VCVCGVCVCVCVCVCILPNSEKYTHKQGPTHLCSHITTHRCISIGYFNTVTLASSNIALPDDGVTAPKHVGAV